jgi:hypothetical protein
MALKAAQGARGKMVPAKDVAEKWRGILAGLRSRFLAHPFEASVTASAPNAAGSRLIGDEIRDALEELSGRLVGFA